MTRNDPELGQERRCRVCREWWPDDLEFFGPNHRGDLRRTCRACRVELARGITPPLRVVTDEHRAHISAAQRARPTRGRQPRPPEAIERRREQDRLRYQRRKAADPEAMRAISRRASMRYYWNHAEQERQAERDARAAKAAAEGRTIRLGFGRPRIAA